MRNIHGIFQKAEYFIAWYALIFCLALTMKKLKTYKEANAYRFFPVFYHEEQKNKLHS